MFLLNCCVPMVWCIRNRSGAGYRVREQYCPRRAFPDYLQEFYRALAGWAGFGNEKAT